MQIKLLVEGGSMSPGPALSQKLGPLGMNMGEIIQKVNDSTKDFKGLKVPVELEIDTGTKEFEVNVFSPPVSELLKKELGIEKGSGAQLKMQTANASIEQIISIAKTKLPSMLCNNLKSAVKTIIGTCVSLGILIENKPAVDIEKLIDSGKYDKEIREERTETFQEKRTKLDKYFDEIHSKQEKVIEQEKAEKEVAEAAKESADTSKGESDKEEAKEESKPKKDK